MTDRTLDLFAGSGGWDRAAESLGNKTQRARQIGNAVPVRLARAVLEAVTQ